MINVPRQPYNLAARFADPEQAKHVCFELESRLKALRFDAHVSRVMVKNEMYVSFLSERPEGTIPAPVLQEVRRILSSKGGQLMKLPPEALANIQARRAQRRAQGIGQYESHEPTTSSYRYPAIRDWKTKEIVAEYPEQGELIGEEPYTGPASGAMEMGEFVKQLESTIHQATMQMEEAIFVHDTEQFEKASTTWRVASENWLMAAQGMSAEEARAAMVEHASGEVTRWMNERRPGPPPTVLDVYNTESAGQRATREIESRRAPVLPLPAPGPAQKETRNGAPRKPGKLLVERYLTYLRVAQEHARARLHDKTGLTQDQYNFNLLLMTSYHDTYSRMANNAFKYKLAASAQTMIEALRPRPLLLEDMDLEVMAAIGSHQRQLDPDIETPVLHLPTAPIWLELEQPVLAANGEIAGIFFSSADHEVEQMLEAEHRPAMREVLKTSVRQPGQEHQWSVHFIDNEDTPTTRYNYQEETRVWSIVPAIREQLACPTGECQEQKHENGTFSIVPCPFCAAMMAYWRSWLVTALLAVAGEFAATETAEWPRRSEQTTRKVKRPNSGKYDEVPVTHEYYLVSFDASIRRVRPEQGHEPQERGSWVAAALEIDPESVVYVRHDFGQSQRRLDPERNPRWKEKRTVDVRAYSKRQPMKVEGLQKRITRVIASRFEKPTE